MILVLILILILKLNCKNNNSVVVYNIIDSKNFVWNFFQSFELKKKTLKSIINFPQPSIILKKNIIIILQR